MASWSSAGERSRGPERGRGGGGSVRTARSALLPRVVARLGPADEVEQPALAPTRRVVIEVDPAKAIDEGRVAHDSPSVGNPFRLHGPGGVELHFAVGAGRDQPLR